MGNAVIDMSMSLDGRIAAPNDHRECPRERPAGRRRQEERADGCEHRPAIPRRLVDEIRIHLIDVSSAGGRLFDR